MIQLTSLVKMSNLIPQKKISHLEKIPMIPLMSMIQLTSLVMMSNLIPQKKFSRLEKIPVTPLMSTSLVMMSSLITT